MSVFAGLVEAAERLPNSIIAAEDACQSLHAYLPPSYSLASLADGIVQLEDTNPKARLVVILACLKNRESLQRDSGERESAARLGDFAAAIIAPCSRRSTGDGDGNTDDENDEFEDTARLCGGLAVYGLEILAICTNEYSARFSNETILTLISYTDTWSEERLQNTHFYHCAPQPNPWATPEASELASRVLDKQLSQYFTTETFIVKTILQDYLRPLFSKSRPSTVTASGRKAEFRDEEDAHRRLQDEIATKPWKYADHRSIPIVSWAVHEANDKLISQQWPLFIPVLLALLDDGTTRVRAAGLHIMKEFLNKFPDNVLHDTGLASVFEDAILPTLHFLPNITPEDESIRLLSPAYKSLLVLAGKVKTRVRSGPNTSHTPRARLLDNIIREGVLSAYFHAKEHIRICQLLFAVNMWIVKDMGINAVKHLKDLIPMHSEVLTDPFASAAPELQHLATKSLGVIIANCWPRLAQAPYQDEILKAIVMCYINAHDDLASNELLQQTKELLTRIATMLYTIADDTKSLRTKIEPLVDKEPILADLFKCL